MSTIYDIAGTSANSFNLNGKVTLLQGDEAPQIYQGVDGDVYFRTNGLIYSKQNGTWLNLSSASLPDAATGDGKFIVSNGQNYEFYDLSVNDIAFLSRNNVFTGSNTFNNVVQGTAFRTYWGDLAEIYETDKEYPKGT